MTPRSKKTLAVETKNTLTIIRRPVNLRANSAWAERGAPRRLLGGHDEISPEDFAEVRPLLLEHPNLQVPVALAREL